MKKYFLAVIGILLSGLIMAQSVGINNTSPHSSAILDVKSSTKGMLVPRTSTTSRNAITNPANGLLLYDTTTAGFWFYNGIQWTSLSSGNSGSPWLTSNSDIYSGNTGNIGIGTFIPAEKLTVQTLNNSMGISHRGENGNILATSMGGTSAGIGTFSHTNMRIFCNGISRLFIGETNGYIGLGTSAPSNKLQIGDTPGFANYDLAIGNGAQGMVFQQNGGFSNWQSNTSITLLPNNGTGNVGINTTTPANKLQIGSIGGAGFTGNDLAIGNGTNAMVVSQTNASTLVASTTDIVLLPRYGGTGRVGINTTTPRTPLDVVGAVLFPASYYDWHNQGSSINGIGRCNPCTPTVSIRADDAVYAAEFDANSDARIKNIIGISNAAKDLEAINALHITDYTMKDKVKYGDRTFKKVIAQEVEEIYPQVVSKHGNFIPNVYQATTRVEKIAAGYLLTFGNKHTISSNAKKLRILLSETGAMQVVDIISIPSGTQVIINVDDIKLDRVFVYGEEVDDFRTVDYEGLTTLNISATQELSRLVKKQEQELNKQNKKIAQLVEVIKVLERKTIKKQPLN